MTQVYEKVPTSSEQHPDKKGQTQHLTTELNIHGYIHTYILPRHIPRSYIAAWQSHAVARLGAPLLNAAAPHGYPGQVVGHISVNYKITYHIGIAFTGLNSVVSI